MNKQRIDDLPWLVTRKQVIQIFGLSAYELAKLEHAGKLTRHCTSRKGKFFKTQIIALLKWELP